MSIGVLILKKRTSISWLYWSYKIGQV